MLDAAISSTRLRDLAGPGRAHAASGRVTARPGARVAGCRTSADPSSIAVGPPRSGAAASRPGRDDLMAAIIQ